MGWDDLDNPDGVEDDERLLITIGLEYHAEYDIGWVRRLLGWEVI